MFPVLNEKINQALTACGYTTPTPIQAKAIPAILEGKDLVASSQTGSGKTAAFVLPALHRLSQQKSSKHTQILVLTPTRELAAQIMTAARKYGKYLKFNIISLVGGMPYGPQIKDLSRGAEIIIATPGRLMDHIDSKRVDLSHINMLVLDEADRMLDMGFIDDVNYIAKLIPLDRQTLLFSATVDKSLAKVVQHLLKDPMRIDMSQEKISVPQIKQEFYKTDNAQHKMRLLKNLLGDQQVYKAIIFTATKIYADRLADELCEEGFRAASLHGDLRQNVRNRRIEDFRRGKIQFLVATDVAARGIDISDVTHVINYDLPRFCEDYVHRIGRTGRAGKEGIAISFVLPADKKHLQNIERFTKQRFVLKGEKGEKIETGMDREKPRKTERDRGKDRNRTRDRNRDRDWGRGKDRDRERNRDSKKSHQKSDKPARKFDATEKFDRSSRVKSDFSDRPNRSYKKDNKKDYKKDKEDRKKSYIYADDKPRINYETTSKPSRPKSKRFEKGSLENNAFKRSKPSKKPGEWKKSNKKRAASQKHFS